MSLIKLIEENNFTYTNFEVVVFLQDTNISNKYFNLKTRDFNSGYYDMDIKTFYYIFYNKLVLELYYEGNDTNNIYFVDNESNFIYEYILRNKIMYICIFLDNDKYKYKTLYNLVKKSINKNMDKNKYEILFISIRNNNNNFITNKIKKLLLFIQKYIPIIYINFISKDIIKNINDIININNNNIIIYYNHLLKGYDDSVQIKENPMYILRNVNLSFNKYIESDRQIELLYNKILYYFIMEIIK